MSKHFQSMLVVGLLTSCGTEIGNPKRPSGTTEQSSAFSISDQSVASELIASQTDEVIASIAAEASITGGGGLGLSRKGPSGLTLALTNSLPSSPQRQSNPATSGGAVSACTAKPDGSALVTVTANGNDNQSFQHQVNSSTFSAVLKESTMMTWKQNGKPMACDSAGDDVVIDWTAVNSLNLVETVSQDLSQYSITRHGPLGSYQRQTQYTLSGTRTATWTLGSKTSAAITINKTVLSQVDKAIVATTRSGAQLTVGTHIAVDPSAPLSVTIDRDPGTQAWISKTILTGVVTTTQIDQSSHVDSTYTNVVFTPASGCVPVSGTITGNIYAGTATDPSQQYQITFYQGAATILYGDGTQADYVPDYCSLDDTN